MSSLNRLAGDFLGSRAGWGDEEEMLSWLSGSFLTAYTWGPWDLFCQVGSLTACCYLNLVELTDIPKDFVGGCLNLPKNVGF